MKSVKIDLPIELDGIDIEIFSDMHLGSKKCDFKTIQERVNKVKENQNTYCIIVGDVLNNSTKTSVGDVYEEQLTPMQQVKQAISIFEPIKDKILGCVSGNHERRSYKTDGIDLLYFMCSELGISDRYDFASCLLFIRLGKSKVCISKGKFRKVLYTLYMTHGSAGGRTVGAKANYLERLSGNINADIIVVGHTHTPLNFPIQTICVDEQNSGFYMKEQYLVNASSTLNYEEYAELYGMRPSSKKSPTILLNGKKKEVKVNL